MDCLKLYEGLQAGTKAKLSGPKLINAVVEADTVESIKKSEFLAKALRKLKDASDGFHDSEIKVLPFRHFKLFESTGDRYLYENEYFERRKRLLALSMNVWLWGRDEDIRCLEDVIWAICDDYTWSLAAHIPKGLSIYCDVVAITAHNRLESRKPFESALNLDLFACETGFALAEVCALLGDKLTPVVVERARREIDRRVVQSYLNQQSLQQWELMDNNWCAVCAGSVGGAALYTIEDDLSLADVIRRLMPTFQRFVGSFGEDDGSSSEGLSYWTYGVSFYVAFADLLKRRTAGKIDILDNKQFQLIAEFQQHCYFPKGATLTFSDAERRDFFRGGLTCYLAEKFDSVYIPPTESFMDDILFLRTCNFAPSFRDLLWTHDTTMRNKTKPPGGSVAFSSSQWLLCSGPHDIGFAAKAGHNGEEHNHNDVGTFIYYRNGDQVFSDIGKGLYDKDYFGPKRYEKFCNSSFSHCVPIIDGKGQKVGREHGAENVKIDPETGTMEFDFAKAYGNPELTKLARKLVFGSNTGSLVVSDSLKFRKSLPVVERFITLVKPTFEGSKVLVNNGSSTTILTNSGDITPVLSEHRHVNHSDKTETIYAVDFTLKGEEIQFFINSK
jgi:Heparinase II/III-like protein